MSLSAVLLLGSASFADAESLRGAMAKAYANNHDLNVARAQLRATDENVPIAKGGLRPTVSAVGLTQSARSRTTFGDNTEFRRLPTTNSRTGALQGAIEINQTIFDGFQTPNNVSAAEAQVRASQKNLDNTVQNTLLNTIWKVTTRTWSS